MSLTFSHYLHFAVFLIFSLSFQLQAAGQEPDFRSEHFAFYSETPQEALARQTVVEVAEATRALLAAWVPEWETRRNIRLFETEAAYLNAGGIDGSGGAHFPKSGDVLLNIGNDGISAAERGILIHEVTHQCLEPMLENAPPWLVEGVALYVESIPFYDGAFQTEWISFRRASVLPSRAQERFDTVPLASLLRSDRFDWNANFRVNPHGVNRHYQTAYLLTYYLIHFQAAPSEDPLGQFLSALDEALKASGSPEEVLRSGPYRPSVDECRALEAQFVAAFSEAEFDLYPLTRHPWPERE